MTAVEWLVEEINRQKAWANPQQLEPIIEQAKAIEKDNICNAYTDGLDGLWISSEEYYNREFKA
jgi:hypothetical protein